MLGPDCTCKEFIGTDGFGNCKKEHPTGKPLCYVTLPSSCSDLRDSGSNPGEKWSFEACKTGK